MTRRDECTSRGTGDNRYPPARVGFLSRRAGPRQSLRPARTPTIVTPRSDPDNRYHSSDPDNQHNRYHSSGPNSREYSPGLAGSVRQWPAEAAVFAPCWPLGSGE